MSTLVAIRTTYPGIDAIVVGADTQETHYEEDELVSVEPVGNKFIINSTDRFSWMVGEVGSYSKHIKRFRKVYSGDGRCNSSDAIAAARIAEAIENFKKKGRVREKEGRYMFFDQPHFLDVALLNGQNTEKTRDFEYDDLNDFLLVSNYRGELGMWEVNCYGFLSEHNEESSDIPCVAVGSGSEAGKNYLADEVLESRVDPDKIDIPVGIDLVMGFLEKSSKKDTASSGKDFWVMTREGIKEYGDGLRRASKKAEEEYISRVKREYLEKS